MELTHSSHEHELILKDIKEEDIVLCNGCKKEISGSGYCCKNDDCEFFLHEKCAQLPKEFNYLMHPDQYPCGISAPLSFQGPRHSICEVCHYEWKGFTYACEVLKFDVCLPCVLQQDVMIKHKSHPHPLKLTSRRANFFCDACYREERDTSYRCTTCEYWIHKSCAFTPNIIECSAHNHPLVLAYSLPSVNRSFDCECDVCGYPVHPSYWVYHCADCRYFAHVKCATRLEQTLGVDQREIIREDLDPNLVQLPAPDKLVDLLSQYIKSISQKDSETPTTLEHWSHDHPLVLYDENISQSNSNNDEMEENEERLCDGCVLSISSFPFYGCKKCNFLLHTSCASIPSTLRYIGKYYDSSRHLGRPPTIYQTFNCSACQKDCNGFFFLSSYADKFILPLCLGCVSTPTPIKHEGHPHPLVFYQDSQLSYSCRGSDDKFSGPRYSCQTCNNFDLNYNCAMLPRILTHDWDKHDIYLSYPPFDWHPDEFYCEICEEQINPKSWLYHCRVCDHSFHGKCLNSEAGYMTFKFGGMIKFANHSHALKLVRKQSPFRCNGCDKLEEKKNALECAQCKFHLCCDCANSILNITTDRRMAPIEW